MINYVSVANELPTIDLVNAFSWRVANGAFDTGFSEKYDTKISVAAMHSLGLIIADATGRIKAWPFHELISKDTLDLWNKDMDNFPHRRSVGCGPARRSKEMELSMRTKCETLISAGELDRARYFAFSYATMHEGAVVCIDPSYGMSDYILEKAANHSAEIFDCRPENVLDALKEFRKLAYIDHIVSVMKLGLGVEDKSALTSAALAIDLFSK